MFCTRRYRNRAHRREAVHHDDPRQRFDPGQVEEAIAFARSHLRIAPEQLDAWNRFVEAVRSGAEGVRQAGSLTVAPGDLPSAPARLARMETVVSAGAGALRNVRPAFEALYAALDRDQRAALEQITGHDGFAHG